MKLIVAFCKNRGIGINNMMPWHIKNDFKNFKKLTVGNGNNAIIMGRQTWLSLPIKNKPLPKRENIVLSRNATINFNRRNYILPEFLPSIESAKDYCEDRNIDDIWLIGGEILYKEALDKDLVDEIYITKIHHNFNCDRFFPNISDYFFLKNKSRVYVENNIHYHFEIYSRKLIEENNISLLHECKSKFEDNKNNADETLQYYKESTI